MSMDLLQPPLLQHATPFEPLHSVLSTCSKTLQVISRKTAGWPFEAVRTAESAETTEAKLDFRDSLHHIPNSSDVWRLLELYSTNRFLLASPYLTQDHLLDLPTFTKQEQLMAKALTVMAPVRADYAVSPYAEAFNWATVIDALRLLVRQEGLVWHRQAFHSIAFRSLLAPAADYARLSEMDERAHAEATSSGGLLKYWFGEPDGNRRNIATCLWRNAENAKGGGRGPGHQEAMRHTRRMFSEWKVEQRKLVVADDVAAWWFEDLHPAA